MNNLLFTNPANSLINTMWDFLKDGGQKGNPESLQNYVYQLIKIMTQKTAGQRKEKKKDIDFRDLDLIIQAIVIEAICLVLDKNYQNMFLKCQQLIEEEETSE